MVLYLFMCNADYELHRIENDVCRVNEFCLGIIMLVFFKINIVIYVACMARHKFV